MLASSIKIFEIFAAALPAALKKQMYKAASVAFIIAIAYRAAVVANNAAGIIAGITPLAELLMR